MNRAGRDAQMAAKMVPPGAVVGVAGNTLAHSKRLIVLVQKTAKLQGVDVSHVTFKPIATDKLGADE